MPRPSAALALALALAAMPRGAPAAGTPGLMDSLQCMSVGLQIAPVLAGLDFSAGMKVPGHPVDWASDAAKEMEDLAGQVSDPVLQADLRLAGQEIGRQQGQAAFTVSPALLRGLKGIDAWLAAHCPQEAGGGTGGPTLADLAARLGPGLTPGAPLGTPGPATAPTPVARVASDAPGVSFAALSKADAAILAAAQGVQLVSAPGPAAIQVIFDPDGPYGAKLFQRLHQSHPFLPVRWVPVAVFGKDSAARATALLTSQSPAQDLSTDLLNFDFTARHGGLAADPDPAPLPPAAQRLGKALAAWGGFTPMIVFRDTRGRWLRTGGADAKVVNSVLARAAWD